MEKFDKNQNFPHFINGDCFSALKDFEAEFPIIVTCPPKGVVLDPFVGSGTTCYIAMKNNRKSIGIDINKDFINYAQERCNKNQ